MILVRMPDIEGSYTDDAKPEMQEMQRAHVSLLNQSLAMVQASRWSFRNRSAPHPFQPLVLATAAECPTSIPLWATNRT